MKIKNTASETVWTFSEIRTNCTNLFTSEVWTLFKSWVDVRIFENKTLIAIQITVWEMVKIKELSFKIDYEKIINRYLEISKNYEIKDKLLNFSSKLRFFLYLYKKDKIIILN